MQIQLLTSLLLGVLPPTVLSFSLYLHLMPYQMFTSMIITIHFIFSIEST